MLVSGCDANDIIPTKDFEAPAADFYYDDPKERSEAR
jgi:hypothetical protein